MKVFHFKSSIKHIWPPSQFFLLRYENLRDTETFSNFHLKEKKKNFFFANLKPSKKINVKQNYLCLEVGGKFRHPDFPFIRPLISTFKLFPLMRVFARKNIIFAPNILCFDAPQNSVVRTAAGKEFSGAQINRFRFIYSRFFFFIYLFHCDSSSSKWFQIPLMFWKLILKNFTFEK